MTTTRGEKMAAPDLDRHAFAERLLSAMTAAGVDRPALAQLTGAHPNRVADWLRPTRWPSISHLVAVAATLGVSVDWLLTGKDSGARRPAPAAIAIDRDAVKVARDLARLAPRLLDVAERARRASGR